MVVLEDVIVRRGRFELGPVNAEFPVGVTALLGANGAGKSTLMGAVVGVLAPARGRVDVREGRGVGAVPGYLPQDFDAPRRVRVVDYLRFVAWCRSSRRSPIADGDVATALRAVGLEDRAGWRFGALSGGMRRRVGVAQALLGSPSVVVLDEPTVGLDPVQRMELRDLIATLGRDRSVIVSTHLAEDVAAVAERVVILAEGTEVFQGTVMALAERGGHDGVTSEAVERGFLSVLGARVPA
ncbi:ATP-binding cassette domain-containing protein [Cellulomonas palmilytica]|uniref:ATP-binding cassette domain-containing protein n=1 Tax=Cellulomonas palmilytica TaxID=2608402 RepID=UPI001F24D147|nr:ATP-binding cassette domain-containing protein [Cellulomonas palmilytica]UJP41144.1 ATP-binding cassette domain-containing protein [Cellulomonas palmilytica]